MNRKLSSAYFKVQGNAESLLKDAKNQFISAALRGKFLYLLYHSSLQKILLIFSVLLSGPSLVLSVLLASYSTMSQSTGVEQAAKNLAVEQKEKSKEISESLAAESTVQGLQQAKLTRLDTLIPSVV